MKRSTTTCCLLVVAALAGCATVPPDITGSDSQLESRQIQTRQYDTLDKPMTMRSVVATLQDLGFTIDQADAELGTITATRHHEYTMRMTVVVFEKGDERISVRANARIGENPVTSARTYQDFFVALDKAMFLTQHNVD
jgi:hypothetical protein